jgi:hypothetical protein
MAIAQSLMGSGIAAQAANNIVGTVTSAATAAGSAITDAYDMITPGVEFTTVGSGQGCQLLACNPGDSQWVYNGNTGNTLLVYPDSASGKINNGSTGAGFSLAVNKGALFIKRNATDFLAILTA